MGRRTGKKAKSFLGTSKSSKKIGQLFFRLEKIFTFIGRPFYFLLFFLYVLIPKVSKLLIILAKLLFFRLKKELSSLFYLASVFIRNSVNFPIKLHRKTKSVVLFYSKKYFVEKTKIFFKKIPPKAKTQKKVVPKAKKIPPKKRLRASLLFKLIIVLLVIFSSSSLASFYIFSFFKDLPSPQKLTTADQILTTKIYDRNGTLLYKIYREKDRSWINLSQLPKHIIQATLAIEDKDFYKHPGLSPRGILRAIYQNLFEKKKTGGSTITQQLIKNTLLTPERTWKRKIKEMVLALMVERVYSKDQILEMYLNGVGYGGATYGIEESSQKYFGKSAQNLDLAEAAFLAGLPASPSLYSPYGNNHQLAKTRQELVLKRMLEDNSITAEEKIKAQAENLKFSSPNTQISAPHFVMYIKEILINKYGQRMIEQGGLEVKTSLDLDLQNEVQKIVSKEISKIAYLKVTNGAALVTNPKTGEILAMVGSKDYFDKDIDGNFNVTTAQRQPGSSIKPVNYSIALENGFTPATLLDDSPIVYKVPGQPPYEPKNYDNRYHGQIPLRIALASSYNVPAVKVLATFGVQRMIIRGQQMGITTWNNPSDYGLSLTLGGGEVKMTDMAVVYSSLANNGIKVELNPILEVRDSQGNILEANPSGKRALALKPATAFLLTNILADNSARTPAFGPNSQLYIPSREIAVKTGTTQNLRDNWTIGYSPSILAAVWVGNNDNSPMSYVASGVTGASPIWRNIMDFVLKNQPPETFPKPESIKEVSICQTTGTLPCDGCPVVKTEHFMNGTEPKSACDPNRWKSKNETAKSPN